MKEKEKENSGKKKGDILQKVGIFPTKKLRKIPVHTE